MASKGPLGGQGGASVPVPAGLQRALTWQQVLGRALPATTTAKEPWLLQLKLEQAQLWSRAGCREEGAVLSSTDQEAPAVSNLPAPVHIGQNEREGLPEEEQTRTRFALGSKAARWSALGGLRGKTRAKGAADGS